MLQKQKSRCQKRKSKQSLQRRQKSRCQKRKSKPFLQRRQNLLHPRQNQPQSSKRLKYHRKMSR
ncbi:hypothetical protein D9C73_020898 [Collichthys lucidus]|uniref:Uncharacterized protein n=1 Tax=Collichthys lucidus TaxID=240159 RepID=A0A4U5VFB9_COLLU|nr:hypothetical protein D9C73_020898 [Collichthys lucidus]